MDNGRNNRNRIIVKVLRVNNPKKLLSARMIFVLSTVSSAIRAYIIKNVTRQEFLFFM